MATARTRSARLDAALSGVRAFEPSSWHHQHLRSLLLAMLEYMEANYCRPKEKEEFDRWWPAIDFYHRLLVSPRLTERGGRDLVRAALALPWSKLEEPAVRRRLLGPAPQRRKRRKARKPRSRSRGRRPARRSIRRRDSALQAGHNPP